MPAGEVEGAHGPVVRFLGLIRRPAIRKTDDLSTHLSPC